MRRTALVILVVALLAGACGDDKKTTEKGTATTKPATAGKEVRVVLDGKTDAFVGEFPFFFPSSTTVHAGDTVRFDQPNASGVPHTVTLGTMVDQGVAKLNQLGPTASFEAQETAPEVAALPDIFTHKSPPGPPVPNQSAAQPCFLATGQPPNSLTGGAPACSKVAQPAFDGTQTFYNSGAIFNDGDSFSMKLADSIKPGTYSIICLVHRGAMTGDITVVDKNTPTPTAAEVEAKGKQEFDAVVAADTPIAEKARKAPASAAFMGAANPEKFQQAVVAEFGPKEVSVPVNGSVTWTGIAFHTLTFNATDADVGAVTRDPNGVVAFNPKYAPAGFDVPADLADFPFPADSKPLTLDLGKVDSDAFKSSGVVPSLPPRLVSLKVTFTKAGTYPVRCLVHPDMKGEVKVG